MFNHINVPSSPSSLDDDSVSSVQLDRQDTALYNYHNITRLAAIYNYLYLDVVENRTADEIYDHFVTIGDPSEILRNFCAHFKDIYYIYLHYRFKVGVNTAFLETDEIKVSPDLPIYTWFSHYTLFTIYSPRHMGSLLQKCAAFVYIYGIDNLIINKEYRDNSKKSFKEQEKERLLTEKTRLISEQLGVSAAQNIDESHTNFCNIYTLPEQQRRREKQQYSFVSSSVGEFLNKNYRAMEAIRTLESVDDFGPDRRFILGGIYPIQTNLNKSYQPQYTKHWAYLNIVYYILESAIRPLIEDITKEKRSDPSQIQIKFQKKDLPGTKGFTHGNIGEVKITV